MTPKIREALTMRRIAAILIAITLMFSAGSSLADDTSEANKLFVEAKQHSLSAEDEKSLEKKAAALEASLAKINEIFDEYISTELAVKLISGQSIGGISLEDVGEAAVRARIMYYEGGSIPENYAEQFMRMFKVLGAK